MKKTSWWLISLLLASSVCAKADYLLVGTTGGNTAELWIASSQFIAQSFTLNQRSRVSEVDLFISGFGVDAFTIQLTDAIGPAAQMSFQIVGSVPEPASLLLLGSGIVAFGILMRRKKTRS